MYVSAASISAIWCPASDSVPSTPTSSNATLNAVNSIQSCSPIGNPILTMRHNGLTARSSRLQWRRNGTSACRHPQSSMIAISHRQMVVAQPEPTGPIAGNPSLPNTMAQSSTTLARLATTTAATTGRTSANAWTVWRSPIKARYGSTPAMQARVYAAASGTTSAGCRSGPRNASPGMRSRDKGTERATQSTSPRCNDRSIAGRSFAPTACATSGSSDISVPCPIVTMLLK
jgi:hypothetical protein